MPATENGGARRGARPLVEDRLHFRVLARVIDMSRESRCVVIHVPRSVRDKILAPAIKHMTMRIGERIGDIHLELLSPRLIAIDAGVSAALRRSIGRFDLRAVKHAFLKIQRPARIEHKAVGRVMSVGRIQPAIVKEERPFNSPPGPSTKSSTPSNWAAVLSGSKTVNCGGRGPAPARVTPL